MRSPHAAAELDDVTAVDQRRVILNLVAVLQIVLIARTRTPSYKVAGHIHGRIAINRVLEGIVAVVLKSRLVDDLGTNHLCVADLHGLLRALGVVALGRKNQHSNSVVGFGIAIILVARGECIVGRQCPVDSRAEIGPLVRVGNRLNQVDLVQRFDRERTR